MDALALGFLVLFALLFFGVPIGFTLLIVGVTGFAAIVGFVPALSMVGQVATDTALNYNFSVLPLFILMGNLVAQSRLAESLYAAASAFVGHHRGGLATATILACGGFSAVSGSSFACAATMTSVSVPEMRRYGYAGGFAAATVAVGGTLGILIPPSVAFVIYSIITEVDLGRLFIAGILPGLLTLGLYAAAIRVVTSRWPDLGPPTDRVDWQGRLRMLARIWEILALFLLVLGGIYFGVFTPTEAAGIGAFGAFVFALLRRSLTFAVLEDVLVQSVRTSAMLFFVIIGALLFANFVTVAGLPSKMEAWISGLQLSPLVMILIILGIYLILGCVLEPMSMMLLTIPVFYPVIVQQAIDPIWFGVFVVIVAEIGLITPPIGMNVFVVKTMLPDVSQYAIFKWIWTFLAADVVRITLIIAFPGIVLALPRLMG